MIGIQEVVDFVVAHKIELEKLAQALKAEQEAHAATKAQLAKATGTDGAEKPRVERVK